MPYKSQAQRGKFHILEKQGKLSPKVVTEWDKASKGLKLPKRVKKKEEPSHLGAALNHLTDNSSDNAH
jgi:hypothetical protein